MGYLLFRLGTSESRDQPKLPTPKPRTSGLHPCIPRPEPRNPRVPNPVLKLSSPVPRSSGPCFKRKTSYPETSEPRSLEVNELLMFFFNKELILLFFLQVQVVRCRHLLAKEAKILIDFQQPWNNIIKDRSTPQSWTIKLGGSLILKLAILRSRISEPS